MASKTFDQMMNDFDTEMNGIIDIARAATLLHALRADSPTTPSSAPTTPSSAPTTPSSPKNLPSVSSKSRNMKRAILARPACRSGHKLTQAELDARKASNDADARWRAKDAEKRRLVRKNVREARDAGDPIAICVFTKERVQNALKPSECVDSNLPRSIQNELESAHGIVTHGPTHEHYRISCARLYVLQDVITAKEGVLEHLPPSEHLTARMSALRAFVVNTDVVQKTAKQLLGL